ncbi:restriction endonuclease subunit S [Pseudomonas fluorescens]|uniref:restriction endonuclease subunit S n=1 Tax=Pseudomonas fluorescens TaxID=294 RepID=UPI0007D05B0A|nr:restriction endonuclease subunit S [Pseudomonas fluorescens]
MNSKTNTTGAKEESKATLVPKLRFPGFDEPWSYDPLSKALKEHKIKNTAGRDVFSVSMEYGIVNQIELLGRSFAAADTSNYTIGRRFDVVYTKSPLKAFPFGVVKQCKFDGEVALSPLYGVFTPLNQHLGLMIEAYFESPNRSKDFLSPLCQKGAKNTLQITNTTFLSGRLPLPTQSAEQQKIAECLNSVDELIAVQARKVAALKYHQKGLMQQLFPRKGETQPRFRFPEFQTAEGWEMKTIGDIFDTSAGGTPERSKLEYWNGSIPWVTTSLVDFNVISCAEEFITNEGLKNSSAKLFPKHTVLVALIGQGKTRGKVALLDCEASTNQNCAAILPTEVVIPNFTFLNLCSRYEEIRALSNTAGQGSLSQGLIRTLPFGFPKDKAEQQRIASCLTSLDDLIAAQIQKHETLRSHKQGLMQQLFPTQEKVA